MLDLTTMRERARAVQALAEAGQQSLEMKAVLKMFVEPLLSGPAPADADDWLTIEEYRARTGVGRNYFEKPLKRLQGRSRLQMWAQEGLARLKSVWLIHQDALPQREATEADPFTARDLAPTYRGSTAPVHPPASTEDEAAEEIFARMMGTRERK